MSIELIGGASTQSRGRRQLPPGAIRSETLDARGAPEHVSYDYASGHSEERRLLTWIVGQAGLLFGGSHDEWSLELCRTHGSYGHRADYNLADSLGVVYDGYLTDERMGVRFFQDGGKACETAARLARYAMSRDTIATQGYHGSSTDFAHEPDWGGYPRAMLGLHKRFEFGDVRGLTEAAQGAACIMVEVPDAPVTSAIRPLKSITQPSALALWSVAARRDPGKPGFHTSHSPGRTRAPLAPVRRRRRSGLERSSVGLLDARQAAG